MAGESSLVDDNPFAIDSANVSSSYEGGGNPNQRLCSALLNEHNYLHWSRAIILEVGGRSKFGYVNGAIPVPAVGATVYDAWQCKDRLVMCWLLNSMESKIAEIFSYSESSQSLWTSVEEMYENQNNAARVFQLKKDIASLQQEEKSFVQYFGQMTSMWNELDTYRPHTTDRVILLKIAEEDKIFQLLANLGSDYEDLRSHVLMNSELPSFKSICATVHREALRRKVMNLEVKSSSVEFSAYVADYKQNEERKFKGKRPVFKCDHCGATKHTIDRYWILHLELKPKYLKDKQS